MISYSKTFKSAWQIVVQNKVLWLLGAFVTLFNSLDLYNLFMQSNIFKLFLEPATLRESWAIAKLLGNVLAADLSQSLVFIGIMIAITGAFVWLATTSQIATILIADASYKKEKFHLGEVFTHTRQKFWQVLGVNIFTKLVILLIGLLLFSPLWLLVSVLNVSANGLLVIVLKLLLLSTFIVFSIITYYASLYAIYYITLKKEKVLSAIKHAINLFNDNWAVSLEVSLILNIITLLVMAGAAIVVFMMLLFLYFVLLTTISAEASMLAQILIGLIVLFIFLMSSGVTLFQLTTWTLLFEQLEDGNLKTKISRIATKIKSKLRKK
jgi:hypothetical protein